MMNKPATFTFSCGSLIRKSDPETSGFIQASPYLDGILYHENIKTHSIPKYSFIENLGNSLQPLCDNTDKDKSGNLDVDKPYFNNIFYEETATLCKKKKKRKPQVTICTSNCRSEAVKRVMSKFGLKAVDEDDEWNIYWTDAVGSLTISQAKKMKRYQRINHFLGMSELSRKDLLAKNLTRMQKHFPADYNFFPKSWCFPVEYNDALYYNKLHKNKIYIIKPDVGCQGRGISITKNLNDVNKNAKLVCQIYISKPYLIDGYKFDIRVYTLISSCDPLRVFVYNEGLVRFATIRYAEPSNNNCENIFMHLTNYSVNKFNHEYIHHNELGSKRKITTLNAILKSRGVDTEKLWKIIDDAIVKTIISAWPIIKHNYNVCFSSHDMIHACFEILGFDVLLDHNLHPYILEVNQSPSFQTDSLIDKEVKESLLSDTLSILNVWQYDKRKIIEEDRLRIQNRLNQKSGTKRSNLDTLSEKENLNQKSPWQEQIDWEESHLGNFRRAYPNGNEYAKYFQQPSNTLFLSTACSRARGECAKQQRDEIETKLKNEIANKQFPSDKKITKCVHRKTTEACEKQLTTTEIHRNRFILPGIGESRQIVYDPSEPVPIIDSEENHRLALIAKRGRLIKNSGILEIIYQIMKTVGTLTTQDELNYFQFSHLPKIKNEIIESIYVDRN